MPNNILHAYLYSRITGASIHVSDWWGKSKKNYNYFRCASHEISQYWTLRATRAENFNILYVSKYFYVKSNDLVVAYSAILTFSCITL